MKQEETGRNDHAEQHITTHRRVSDISFAIGTILAATLAGAGDWSAAAIVFLGGTALAFGERLEATRAELERAEDEGEDDNSGKSDIELEQERIKRERIEDLKSRLTLDEIHDALVDKAAEKESKILRARRALAEEFDE